MELCTNFHYNRFFNSLREEKKLEPPVQILALEKSKKKEKNAVAYYKICIVYNGVKKKTLIHSLEWLGRAIPKK